MSPAREADKPLRALTARQLEVLKLSARGFKTPEIGRLLGCKHTTVITHLVEIRTRWDVSSTIEAAVLAVRRGVI